MYTSNTAQRVLIRLLAQQDGLYISFRFDNGPWYGAAWRARWDYPQYGMSWRNTADGAESKQIERSLGELASGKLIKRFRPRGAKTLAVKLTDLGDQYARRLADVVGLEAGINTCFELHALQNHPDSVEDGLVPEILLNHGRGWGDRHHEELRFVEYAMLPALVRGWVASRSDTFRRVYYLLTSDGEKIVNGTMRPTVADNLPDPLPDGCRIYFESLAACLDTILSRNEPTSELGEVPLSASLPRRGARSKTKRKGCKTA